MKEKYRIRIRERVGKLVSQLEGRKLSDRQLQDKFDEQWSLWIIELEAMRMDVETVNIRYEVERSLTELTEFKMSGTVTLLLTKLRQKSLEDWGSSLKLTVKDVHVCVPVGMFSRFKTMLGRI